MDTLGAVFTAIYNKFIGDADLLAALGGDTGPDGRRMYNKRGKQDPTYPYVVAHIITAIPEDTLSEEGELLQVQFNIFDYDRDSPDDDSTVNEVYSKLDDLYNKCDLTVAGYNFIYMMRQLVNPIETIDDTQQVSVTYEVMIQEQ